MSDRWTNRTLTKTGQMKAGGELLRFSKGFVNPMDPKSNSGKNLVVYPTNIPELDYFLTRSVNGEMGFAAGHWHMITGRAQTMKSAVLDRIKINVLNAGGSVYHFERDGHWNLEQFMNGIAGRIVGDPEEAMKRYHLAEVAMLEEVYIGMSNVLIELKEELYAEAKKRKVQPWDLYFARDIRPVIFIIDSLAGFTSEKSLVKEMEGTLGDRTSIGEENNQIHRLIKTTQGLMGQLGVSTFIANQFRANIGGSAFAEKERPYAWSSIQYELHTSIDVWVQKKRIVSRKQDYQNEFIINPKIRKGKGVTNAKDDKCLPISFFPHYGFDVIRGVFSVLNYAGYLQSSPSSFTILEENKDKRPLPASLEPYAETHDRKEFFSNLRDDPQYAREFYLAYKEAEGQLLPEWVEDRRDGNIDEAVFAPKGFAPASDAKKATAKPTSKSASPKKAAKKAAKETKDDDESDPVELGKQVNRKSLNFHRGDALPDDLKVPFVDEFEEDEPMELEDAPYEDEEFDID